MNATARCKVSLPLKKNPYNKSVEIIKIVLWLMTAQPCEGCEEGRTAKRQEARALDSRTPSPLQSSWRGKDSENHNLNNS